MDTAVAPDQGVVSSRAVFEHKRFKKLYGKRFLVQLREDVDRVGDIWMPGMHERMSPMIAEVIQVGSGYHEVQDKTTPVVEGSLVLLTPWAGKTNNSYFWDDSRLIVNDYEVWAVVSEDDTPELPLVQ